MCSMKTILYLSQCTDEEKQGLLTYSLASIIISSRAKNRNQGVSSILCQHNNHYFQVLEGPEKIVNNLFKTIKNDSRHKDVKLLVEASTNQPFFEKNPLRVASGHNNEPQIFDFFSHHNIGPVKINGPLSRIINDIIKNPNQYTKVPKSERFSGMKLTLTQWPMFDILSPTRDILELCAMLIASIDYEQLYTRNPFASEQELNRALTTLKDMSILESSLSRTTNHERTTGTFFRRIKSFIGGLST